MQNHSTIVLWHYGIIKHIKEGMELLNLNYSEFEDNEKEAIKIFLKKYSLGGVRDYEIKSVN